MLDRRAFILGGAALAAACSETSANSRAPAKSQAQSAAPDFAAIQATLGAGARLGVFALDTGSGRTLAHDADSRYAMCSSFKLPLAAAILAEADRGALALDREIAFTPADFVTYSPVIEANMALGRLPIERLCAAIVEVSDNTAANLLLAQIGGPAGLTVFFRRCGDTVTRLDRTEPTLNSNIAGDPRDTTTPAAMTAQMRAFLFGDILSPAARARLIGWMEAASTGRNRLRAGFPPDWRAGDKTGTANGANIDLAIAWAPQRAPILIASLIDARGSTDTARNAAHAAVARGVATAFA